jgi:hypothetical protein
MLGARFSIRGRPALNCATAPTLGLMLLGLEVSILAYSIVGRNGCLS